jgi:hypothetical protein
MDTSLRRHEGDSMDDKVTGATATAATQAAGELAKRASSASVSFLVYSCASLLGIAAILLLDSGFREVILHQPGFLK